MCKSPQRAMINEKLKDINLCYLNVFLSDQPRSVGKDFVDFIEVFKFLGDVLQAT